MPEAFFSLPAFGDVPISRLATSHTTYRERIHGQSGRSFQEASPVSSVAPSTTKFRLPPPFMVDKQHLFSPRDSSSTQLINPMKQPTWELMGSHPAGEAHPQVASSDFWHRIDEQETQLQAAGTTTSVGLQMVGLRRCMVLDARARHERALASVNMRPHTGRDIVPALARYQPNEMAGTLSPRDLEARKPFHRRTQHDVAGARVISVPRLYLDKSDYMSTRYAMRTTR